MFIVGATERVPEVNGVNATPAAGAASMVCDADVWVVTVNVPVIPAGPGTHVFGNTTAFAPAARTVFVVQVIV